MRASLRISLAQITHDGGRCAHCDSLADVTVMTGADPQPEPMCWTHARSMLDLTRATGERIFGVENAA